MPLFLKRHMITVGCIFAGLVVSLVYTLTVPPLFRASGETIVFRAQMANPELVPESVKNRWAWVRDGLATRDALLSDDWLLQLVKNLEKLGKRYEDFMAVENARAKGSEVNPSDLSLRFAALLRSKVQIEFTGADVFSYRISVTDGDARLAKDVTEEIIRRFPKLFVDRTARSFEKSIAALEKHLLELNGQREANIRGGKSRSDSGKHETDTAYLAQTIEKLIIAQQLFISEADERIKILRHPVIPNTPIWPKPSILILVGVLLGLTLGLTLEYLLGHRRKGV